MDATTPATTVALVNAVQEVHGESLRQAVTKLFHNYGIAETLIKRGFHVIYIHAFHDELIEFVDGIEVYTFKSQPPPKLHQPSTLRWKLGIEHNQRYMATTLLRLLKKAKPDIVHCYGFTLWPSFRDMLCWARKTGLSISWSDHGGSPPRNPVRRWCMHRTLKLANVLFTPTPERLQMWEKGLRISAGSTWVVQPETSTRFELMAQDEARKRTGMSGNPILISTSNLLIGKRPNLMLDAFEALLPNWPEARLYLCYRFDDLLPDIQHRLSNNPKLANAVTLMEEIPYNKISDVYNSADIYILTSKREIGSASLPEAMACGAFPVCTNIPSLRSLLGTMYADSLFSLEATGHDIAQSMLPLKKQLSNKLRLKTRAYFESHLSYDQIVDEMIMQWARAKAVGKKKVG